MYIPFKPLFSRHKGIGVQFTDEPTGSLDGENRDRIMEILTGLNQKGHTIVMVTHDKELAGYSSRIIQM